MAKNKDESGLAKFMALAKSIFIPKRDKTIPLKVGEDELLPDVVATEMIKIGNRPSHLPSMNATGVRRAGLTEKELPVEEFWKLHTRTAELEESYRSLNRINGTTEAGQSREKEMDRALYDEIMNDEGLKYIYEYTQKASDRSKAASFIRHFVEHMDKKEAFSVHELFSALLASSLVLKNTTITENVSRIKYVVSGMENLKRDVDDICKELIDMVMPELEILYKTNFLVLKKRNKWFRNNLMKSEAERLRQEEFNKIKRNKKAKKAISFGVKK